MTQSILVPLDGSALAETVLPHVTALARATARSLTLLTIVPRPSMLTASGWPPALPQTLAGRWETELAVAREYLATVAADLRAAGLEVQTRALGGDPREAIVAHTAWDQRIGMIAMATHGRGGLSRLLYGSVAEQVIQTTPVPLLLVNASAATPVAAPTLRTIVVPLDGSLAGEQALSHAQPIAAATGARLCLVAVVHAEEPELALMLNDIAAAHTVRGVRRAQPWETDLQRSAIDRLDDYLALKADQLRVAGIEVLTAHTYGDPAAEIVQFSAEERADLLVLTTHGRAGFGHQWRTEVAHDVLCSAPAPVLFVRVRD